MVLISDKWQALCSSAETYLAGKKSTAPTRADRKIPKTPGYDSGTGLYSDSDFDFDSDFDTWFDIDPDFGYNFALIPD